MKIAVCVKQVLDTSIPLKIDEVVGGLVEDHLTYILNPADQCAVEEAVRLTEKQGCGEVTAITLGPVTAQNVLHECLIMGADRALHLLDKAFDNSDAYSTGFALAHAIKALDCDLIFCGSESLDERSSQVGAVIAEVLDLPQVSAVTKLDFIDTLTYFTVQRKLDRGCREVIECPLPAVLTIDASINKPRYPTIRMRKKGLQKKIEVCDLESLGLKMHEVGSIGALTKHIKLGRIRPRTKKTFTPDCDVDPIERLRLMMSGQAVQTNQQASDILKGDPDYVAQQILCFMRQHGLMLESVI